MRRFSPLVVLVLCLSCAEPPEVEQERTALEAQLLERQVVLAEAQITTRSSDSRSTAL